MNYVIEYNGCYIRVIRNKYMTPSEFMDKVFAVEHGLNLTEKPDIYNSEDSAREVIKLIREQKDEIMFRNLNVLGKITDGNNLDVAKLRVMKIYLLDADKNDEKQMREMFNTVLDKDLERFMLEFLDKYENEFTEYGNIKNSSYYRGAKDMLEAIISNGYENNLSVRKSDKHYIGRLFE